MSVVCTVALCTHNHIDQLRRTLADLRALQTPERPWEFLVIDNRCSDGTSELLAGHEWPAGWPVRIVREERLGLSNARNRAIDEARGEYLIFIDDDETPVADWLCAYERLIVEQRPDAFGGPIRVGFDGPRPAWLRDELLGFLGEISRGETVFRMTDPSESFFGGNFGFRRSVCGRVGRFDPMLGRKGSDNTGGEEVDFYRRLLAEGFSVWWTPDATILHRVGSDKLRRSYFYDLHYRMGHAQAIRERGFGSRLPPRYFLGQLLRAFAAAREQRRQAGQDASVRREMNVAYFLGRICGWAFGPRLGGQ